MLGYSSDHLHILLVWLFISATAYVIHRLRPARFWIIVPPAVSLGISIWAVLQHRVVDGTLHSGFMFLSVISLLHTLMGMFLAPEAVKSPGQGATMGMLILTGFCYFTENLYVFGLFWFVSGLPSIFSFKETHKRQRHIFVAHHLVSSLCLFAAVILLNSKEKVLEIADLTLLSASLEAKVASVLFILAASIRQGLVPFHLWFKASYKVKPFPHNISFYTGNLGFVLFYRVAIPLLSIEMRDAFPYVMVWSIASAFYCANMSLVQNTVRSSVFYVMLSQYATLFCGLEVGTQLGTVGVLFQLLTLGCAFSGLIACVHLLEWHFGELHNRRFHGLQDKNPTLALLFLIFSFCAVGLPLSMSFVGEDMIFHAVIEQYPWIGMGLIMTAALNGISLFRVVSFIFRGNRVDPLDAKLKITNWSYAALGLVLAILFVFGFLPKVLIKHVMQFL